MISSKRNAPLLRHPAEKIKQSDKQIAGADFNADDGGRLRVERQIDRLWAALPAVAALLDDQSLVAQPCDDGAGGRTADADQPTELRLLKRAVLAQQRQD